MDKIRKRLARFVFVACCVGAMAACHPPKASQPDISSETAPVEEKLQRFKAEPNRATMDEVDRAMADLGTKIKELEAREPKVTGNEKDQVTGKLSALRTKYNVYVVEITAVKVQAVTDRAVEKAGDAVEKAGDAVKDAADSVKESLKSTDN